MRDAPSWLHCLPTCAPAPDPKPRDQSEGLRAPFVFCLQTLSSPLQLAPAFFMEILRQMYVQGPPPCSQPMQAMAVASVGWSLGWADTVGRDCIQGQPTIHSCILLYEARVVLDLILSHSATVPKPPVGARHFARHPGGVKLNKTLSLPPWEFYSPLSVIRQPHEELSFLPARERSLVRAVQREERPAAFLL